MEGGVFDDERINSLKRGREEEDEKGNMGRLEKRPSGMVIIEEYNGDEMINGVKYEEEKESLSPSPVGASGKGLFNQFITNLVSSPRDSERNDSGFEMEKDKDGENGVENGGGGGVINNLISNIFSGNGDGSGGEVVDKDSGGGEEVVEDGGGDGDGKVVADIVAQLPRTLSEDTPPVASDEASILLHSIIHD